MTNHWRRYGLEPVVHVVNWRDGENFAPKLDRLLDLVDDLSVDGDVSMVGTSAGGSAVINALFERPVIKKIVCVCCRLGVGTHTGIHSFEARTASSPAFAQSVKMAENSLAGFSAEQKSKIMTMRALMDELVPAETASIPGAKSITIPMVEHVLSITMALTLGSKPLIRFLTKR